jgi:hypothetical protein
MPAIAHWVLCPKLDCSGHTAAVAASQPPWKKRFRDGVDWLAPASRPAEATSKRGDSVTLAAARPRDLRRKKSHEARQQKPNKETGPDSASLGTRATAAEEEVARESAGNAGEGEREGLSSKQNPGSVDSSSICLSTVALRVARSGEWRHQCTVPPAAAPEKGTDETEAAEVMRLKTDRDAPASRRA